jgi:hypothetical protein
MMAKLRGVAVPNPHTFHIKRGVWKPKKKKQKCSAFPQESLGKKLWVGEQKSKSDDYLN